MSGIYKITNNINGHCYIGLSKDIEKRWQAHKRHLTINTNDRENNYPLYLALENME